MNSRVVQVHIKNVVIEQSIDDSDWEDEPSVQTIRRASRRPHRDSTPSQSGSSRVASPKTDATRPHKHSMIEVERTSGMRAFQAGSDNFAYVVPQANTTVKQCRTCGQTENEILFLGAVGSVADMVSGIYNGVKSAVSGASTPKKAASAQPPVPEQAQQDARVLERDR